MVSLFWLQNTNSFKKRHQLQKQIPQDNVLPDLKYPLFSDVKIFKSFENIALETCVFIRNR